MGKLSIVATPIGNLDDITFRAIETLQACDVVYAEDTRVISKLLSRYNLHKPLQRLDAVTEAKKAGEVMKRLEAGEQVVYVSDAGTPGISDPGTRLVALVREALPETKIEAIPGPSALAAACSIAGLDTSEFIFLGFLPNKKGRQTTFKEIAAEKRTTIFYESPHRIDKMLASLVTLLPERRIAVCRELTKIHEEVVVGTPSEVQAHFAAHPDTIKGEFVIIVERVLK